MNEETLLNSFEEVLILKEKNLKKWEDIFPTFYSLVRTGISQLSSNIDFMKDLKSVMEYAKPLAELPAERKAKRFSSLKEVVSEMKEKYLIDNTIQPPEKSLSLYTDVKFLKGVGEKRAGLLNSLEIRNIYDLFYFVPREYEDRRNVKTIFNCSNNEPCVIVAKVLQLEESKVNNSLKILNVVVSDDTGILTVSFFNQEYLKTMMTQDSWIAFFGKTEEFYGRKIMKSPDFHILADKNSYIKMIHPVYPLTKGLSQQIAKNILMEALKYLSLCEEFIPESIIEKYNILSITSRIKGVHFPKTFYHRDRALFSMKVQEAVTFETAVLLSKNNAKTGFVGTAKVFSGELSERFVKSLPFSLTSAQKKAYSDIQNDLRDKLPMNRLLQGDVGSGKTVVAQMAMLDTVQAGFQVAMMVPTSVLARQHYAKLTEEFSGLDINVSLLLGDTKDSEKNEIKKNIETGQVDILIGTHALIQENVSFKNLGLAVIDEQHRFGVNQRLSLINKGISPDFLVMTATPIPRTLALTVYGELDISTIDQMPKGRKNVITRTLDDSKRKEMYSFVREELSNNNKVFFVYPLIEESEKVDLKSAQEMYSSELKNEFSDYGVGLIHGKMSSFEKNEIMEKFSKGSINVLVSTTVIEVGIDIPQATVMVVEHAERFGLSQLHQLRGRVGRSNRQSYCFLIISDNTGDETKQKIIEFASTTDGFKVADMDLAWRGPGKFFDIQQHGIDEFKFIDLSQDILLISSIRNDISNLLSDDPNLQKYPDLKKEVYAKYGKKLKLIKAI
ncbi:MAG TPA: ATP-dependent DNA helicase RecG [Petrotogaceae bacterium]|nr:ATP-dependent DNA helicase RecG [Petrotogaceae bacterium]